MKPIAYLFLTTFLFTPGFAQEPGPAQSLHIISEPATAQVFVNGQEVGYTPLDTDLPLTIGDRIQAFAYGFKPWTLTLIAPILEDTVAIPLTRQKARLVIRSDQLDALSSEVRLSFADQDTVFSGFVNIGRGNVTFEADVYVGKYRLEISKPGFNPQDLDLFVPERGKLVEISLTKSPLPLTSLSVRHLLAMAEQYRFDSARLLNGALAIGGETPTVEADPDIRLFDQRLVPFMRELERYTAHTLEVERAMQRTGETDLGIRQVLAQIYVYRGIVLGKYRRFEEAHHLFQTARERSPFPVEQETSPLPGDALQPLGDLMGFVDTWHNRLGRVDVTVNPDWLINRGLSGIPLHFSQVQFTRKFAAAPPSSPAEQAMHDSLVMLAEQVLQDKIQNHINEFSLSLPRGHYVLKDERGLAVPVSFWVDAPTAVRVDPRVAVWLPEAKTVADTVHFYTLRSSELGPIVRPDQVAFGREYELIIRTGDYKHRRERVIFYRTGGLKPIWPGVTAISAEPGQECLYFKSGSNKLHSRMQIPVKMKRKKLLLYLLVPIAAGIGLAM